MLPDVPMCHLLCQAAWLWQGYVVKSKLATVGVTCDCKGSQLLKGEAKFEKEEDKAGQKSDEVQQEEFFLHFGQFHNISQYFTHLSWDFQCRKRMLTVEAKVDEFLEKTALKSFSAKSSFQKPFSSETGMARLLLWPCSMKIAGCCTFHVTN